MKFLPNLWLHDFVSPRDIYGRPEQKKLLSHYYFHQTMFPIIWLQTLSDLSLSEVKLLPYYLFYVVKGNLCHPGTLWLSEDVFLCIFFVWIMKSWKICQWIVLTPFRITKKCVTLKSNQYCLCYNHLKIRTLLSQGDTGFLELYREDCGVNKIFIDYTLCFY